MAARTSNLMFDVDRDSIHSLGIGGSRPDRTYVSEGRNTAIISRLLYLSKGPSKHFAATIVTLELPNT